MLLSCVPDRGDNCIFVSDSLTVTLDSVIPAGGMARGPLAAADTSLAVSTRLDSESPLLNGAFIAGAGSQVREQVKVPESLGHIYIDSFDWLLREWETYKLTSDSVRLADAYTRGMHAVEELCRVNWHSEAGLISGVPDYRYGESGCFPSWATDTDLFQMFSLGANVMYSRALGLLCRMGREIENDDNERIVKLRDEINRNILNRFWIPNLGFFSEMLYGGYFPIQSQRPDNYAQAWAVVDSIVPDYLAETLLRRTPLGPEGVPDTWPLTRHAGEKPRVSAQVQSVWAEAAASLGNEDAFNIALAALLSGDRECAPYVRRLVIRSIAGIRSVATGLMVSPFMPVWCRNGIAITGLRYRNATLDIKVSGSGKRVGSFSIDGIPTWSCFIPRDLEGRHTVTVVMSDDAPPCRGVEIVTPAVGPSEPEVTWNVSNARIINFSEGDEYMLYVNGTLDEQFSSADIELFRPRSLTQACVAEVSGERWTGYASRPYRWGSETMVLDVDSVMSRRRRHTVEAEIDMSKAGACLIECRYSATETRLLSVECNGRHAGYFILPATVSDSVAALTNPLKVDMVEGVNRISLSAHRSGPAARLRAVHVTPVNPLK